MSTVEAQELRRVLGHFPTGVTVITAHGEDGPVGMAANSFTSVSLEPPLVLICPAKSSTTWPLIRAARRFCANILAQNHAEICRQFAQAEGDRFAGVSLHERPFGPALDEAVAWIECEIDSEYDAGDHRIVVARVDAIQSAEEAEPLVFFRGGFGRFLSAPAGE
jgi:3-hydroxy-9,10-secoandrosta-1,3,5(10)-triene-9,17-dione monooxygenase reductase component